jgi:hypothetical protein
MNLNFYLQKKSIFIISLIILLLYWLPYLILGSDASLTIHDNLDAIFTNYKILFSSGNLFSSNTIRLEQMMSGLPRGTFNSELHLSALFNWIFGPLNAYIFEKLFTSFIGFLGMYLLLSEHLLKDNKNAFIISGTALCYALLPYYPYGLSVSGIPLISCAFLTVRLHGLKLKEIGIIFLFAFYSSIVLSGFFILLFFSCLWSYDFFRKKSVNWHLFFAISLLSILYVVSTYRLFISFFHTSNYVSNRIEYNIFKYFPQSINDMIDVFINGQYHAASLQKWVIIPAVVLSFILIKEKREKAGVWYSILTFITLNALLYGFISWHNILKLLAPVKKVLPMEFERFHWLNPMLWHMLFALSLLIIYQNIRIGKILVYSLLAGQLVYCFSNHELWVNRKSPSVSQFYAEKQFKMIRDIIGKPQKSYRVASLGLHPSISLYNGFYTIDGYSSDYPLAYKYEFRKIIAKELDKSKRLREYYDNYGARVYLFPGMDLGFLNYKKNDVVLKDLEFDTKQMKAMDCKYILSAVRIDSSNLSYKLISKVTDSNSAWDIYIYELV